MFDLTKLQKLSTARSFEKNQLIIKEGDNSNSMFIVLTGSARVVKNYGSYDQVAVAILNPGEFFGEMSLFLSKPRTASVIAVEDTIVLEMDQSNVYQLIEDNPEMLFSIIKTLCLRIEDLNERVRTVKA